jgi:hypothetical protein
MGRRREPTEPVLTAAEREWKYLQEMARGEWGHEELIVRLAREEVDRRKAAMEKQADQQSE